MNSVRQSDLPKVVRLSEVTQIAFWMRSVGDHQPQLCCDAVVSVEPKSDVLNAFKELGAGSLPVDEPSAVKLPYSLSHDALIGLDRKIPEKWIVPFEILPHRMKEFASNNHKYLADILVQFVKTLRWMQRSSGRQNPFAVVGYFWSLDNSAWLHMPIAHSVFANAPKGIDISELALTGVRDAYRSENREPLSHELVREALGIAISNPRSALLIGMSALETGLKNYLEHLVAGSGIILEKLPAPPVITMLQEIIPSLHRKFGTPNDEFPLDRDRSDYLKKWVSQRNQVAHGIKADVDSESLLVFLKFVRAILYSLDLCRGMQWAGAFALSAKAGDGSQSEYLQSSY